MATASVKEFNGAWWSEIYNRIIGAVVFLDDASAECLHWEGGLFNLMTNGAVGVKSLSAFEICPKEHKKAVFITQATELQLSIINEIILHSDITHCILISCISLDVVYVELNDGKDVSDILVSGRATAEATKQLEEMLTDWIGKKQSIVDVIHIPIFTISVTNNIFTTPPYQHIYPSFDGVISTETFANLYALSSDERTRVRRLASGLNSMLDSMNLKEDLYYIGSYSALVAGVLENSPISLNRRKNCLHPATLIIIDRTIDLCGVTSHTSESVLDKIMAVLPRIPGHSNEVAVDMTVLAEANVIHHPEDIQLSPGCIYHASDDSCIQTFDHMINKSQKEVMLDLYNKLSKIDVQKSPSSKNLLKVTPQSIEKIVNATKGNYKVISEHLGLLQQALAVVQTLKSPQRAQIELLTGLEKQVLQSLAVSRESTSVLQQICHLIRTRKERNMTLENLLTLVVHIYSLIGNEVSFPILHEENLVETLGAALFEDHRTLLTIEPGTIITPEACFDISKGLMERLKQISVMRKNMQKYSSVLKPCETGVGDEYKGVLQQLIDDVVNTEKPELVDLSHRSEGLKDLFRAGFGILTKKPRGQKHPLDNQTVIVFVIGGMTAEECKRLHRSVITSGIDNTVLFGSTKLVTPVEAMRDALGL